MAAGDLVEMTYSLNGGLPKVVKGRAAWALGELIAAGRRGVTPIDRPAPRWSHYVFTLRRDGLDIETIDERHGGAYSGTHARYVLNSAVRVLARKRRVGSAVVSEAA